MVDLATGSVAQVGSGWLASATVVLVAYALGTIPTATLVGERVGRDPRSEGSHNPGATNVYRLAGWQAGALVLAVDVGKGAAAAGLGLGVADRRLALAAGVAAVVGHVAPLTRRLRGGKGVATAGGMALVLWPWISVALAALFVVALAVVRMASVASLSMAVGLPIGVAVVGHDHVEVAAALAVALLVVVRHHGNIARLLRGEESAVGRPGPIHPPTDPRPGA